MRGDEIERGERVCGKGFWTSEKRRCEVEKLLVGKTERE